MAGAGIKPSGAYSVAAGIVPPNTSCVPFTVRVSTGTLLAPLRASKRSDADHALAAHRDALHEIREKGSG